MIITTQSVVGADNRLNNDRLFDLSLSEALVNFIDKYIFLHGYSPRTAESYEWAVGLLIKSVGDITLEELTLDHLIAWRHDVEGRLAVNGVNTACYKIRKFLQYYIRHKKIDIDLEEFIIPKKESKLPSFLTDEQMLAIYEACRGARERLIISLLHSTGIRVGELIHIKITDIYDNKLLIHGKGSRERYVFLDHTCKVNIVQYLDSRSSVSEYLFDSMRGGHLDKGAIERAVSTIGLRARVNKPVTPHLFRHSYATSLLEQGCGLRHIQTLLGHSDISTTQIYTHVTDKSAEGAFEKYHVTFARLTGLKN